MHFLYFSMSSVCMDSMARIPQPLYVFLPAVRQCCLFGIFNLHQVVMRVANRGCLCLDRESVCYQSG